MPRVSEVPNDTPKKRRLLDRRPTETDSTGDWAEVCAENTEECFQKGLLYGTDRSDTTKAIFQLRSFRESVAELLSGEAPEAAEKLPENIKNYIPYFVGELWKHRC